MVELCQLNAHFHMERLILGEETNGHLSKLFYLLTTKRFRSFVAEISRTMDTAMHM